MVLHSVRALRYTFLPLSLGPSKSYHAKIISWTLFKFECVLFGRIETQFLSSWRLFCMLIFMTYLLYYRTLKMLLMSWKTHFFYQIKTRKYSSEHSISISSMCSIKSALNIQNSTSLSIYLCQIYKHFNQFQIINNLLLYLQQQIWSVLEEELSGKI